MAAKDLRDPLPIPSGGVVQGTVSLPASKSLAQRALILAALAEGHSQITGLSESDDIAVLMEGLRRLQIPVTQDSPQGVTVTGCGGKLAPGAVQLEVGNNGTALRFLTAISTLRCDSTCISGASHRPVGPLVRALRELGASIHAHSGDESPPVEVQGGPLRGGAVSLSGEISSQFGSALLLCAAAMEEGLFLHLSGEVVSEHYLRMTVDVLRHFGVEVAVESDGVYRVPAESQLKGSTFQVETDSSAAAFYQAAAAVTGGKVELNGFGDQLQGDAYFTWLLKEMGCSIQIDGHKRVIQGGPLKAIQVSLRDTPDLVPPLVAVAPFAEGTTSIGDVEHLKYKESDRLQVLCSGLQQLGVPHQQKGNTLEITGSSDGSYQGAILDPADDHRMAMAFAILGLRVPEVKVASPGCVAKSDPQFFTRLFQLLRGLS